MMVRRSFRDDGVCLLKIHTMQASSYEFMAESSRQGSTAYWSKSIIKIEKKVLKNKRRQFYPLYIGQVLDGVRSSEQVGVQHIVPGRR